MFHLELAHVVHDPIVEGVDVLEEDADCNQCGQNGHAAGTGSQCHQGAGSNHLKEFC